MDKTAFSYARVASKLQESGIKKQLQKITDFTAKKDVEIIKEYQDIGSAFGERPGFSEMIGSIKFRDIKVDCIYVTNYSRFSRDSLQSETLKEELKKLGVEIIAIEEMTH